MFGYMLLGNSMRAVKFCQKLIETFNFHNYDSLRHTQTKANPRKSILESNINQISSIIYAAFNDDINFLMRYA